MTDVKPISDPVVDKTVETREDPVETNTSSTGKMLTQEQMNSIIAKEKRVWLEQRDEMLTKIESLQSKSSLSDEERASFEEEVKNLRNMGKTKENIAKENLERQQKEYQLKLEKLTKDLEEWKGRYTHETIISSIESEAVKANAFNPQNIVDHLGGRAKLVPELDEEGKETGKLITQVTFTDVGEDGKEMDVNMSIQEAVTRMTQLPDRYGNLFSTTKTQGLGLIMNDKAPAGKPDFAKMSAEEWDNYVEKHGMPEL